MRNLLLPTCLALLSSPLVLAVACGGSTASPSSAAPPASTDAGSVEETSTTPEAGDDAPASTSTTPPVATTASFGTYIVLGDSISDRGGAPPFFYDLLHQNDDTNYPTWKGHDLSTRFPGIQYVHAAVAGSITAAYGDTTTTGAPVMSDQITGLGSSYPGDILVTITIGGNDLNDHAGDAVLGLDAPEKMKFAANLKADLDALTAPGRLGAGKLYILEANIYDSSDGQGDWSKGGAACPRYTVAGTQDQMVFSDWNEILTQAITAHSGDYLFDIHSLFAGHGFNSSANWYYSDCIHPNKIGHNELRREAWRLITGESIAD
ncbi:MAG TPA: SGNH/GDSL hydrolase family protein [Solirubrobacteraceae bacterium]